MNRVTRDENILHKQIQLVEFLRKQCMDEKDCQDYLQFMSEISNNFILPDIPPNQKRLYLIKPLCNNVILEANYEISNKTKRNREKKNNNLFLEKIIPNLEYSPEELTNICNTTFETNIINPGFGKLNETKS